MTRQPITIHGRDHEHGGADVVRIAWEDTGTSGVGGYPDYETGVGSVGTSLRAYWRLGEGTSLFADTSGYSVSPADASAITSGGTGTPVPMTLDFTPGAPITDDDGAVQFNLVGTSAAPGDYLLPGWPPGVDNNRTRFAGTLPFTVACWIRPLANGGTWKGTIIGNVVVTSSGSPGENDNGWRLDMDWPTRVVGITRACAYGHSSGTLLSARSPAGLAADTWQHVVGSYDGAMMRLYLNGGLVALQADTGSSGGGGLQPYIGLGPGPWGGGAQWFYGAVDEVSIWGSALSAYEVATLYASGT